MCSRFLLDPTYRVRGITRNPSSPAALALAKKGVEVVAANLDDVSSLVKAFSGANLIFSVTDYWEPFFRPDCRAKAAEKGISCAKYAYEVEYQQGKNIADAVAEVVGGLDENGFIASTLSHAGKSSKGRYEELYHFDSKADAFPFYLEEKYPEVGKKASFVQTGYFMSSYKLAPEAYFAKVCPACGRYLPYQKYRANIRWAQQTDGSFQMSFPTSPEAQVPHFAVNDDMGNFVYAVSQLPPGQHYLAEGATTTWTEFLSIWGKLNGVKTKYQELTLDQFIEICPDKPFGKEAGDMFAYTSDPGYDGGDKTLLKAEDIRKVCYPITR